MSQERNSAWRELQVENKVKERRIELKKWKEAPSNLNKSNEAQIN